VDPFPCPHCRATLILPDHYAGRKLPCPSCQREIVVPCATPAAEASESGEEEEESKTPAGLRPAG